MFVDEAYATVQEKGDQTLSFSTSSNENHNSGVIKVVREVSVSYDLIGEDSYLISGTSHDTGQKEGETTLSCEDEVGKYSKITSSIGVKILEDGCAELRHLTDNSSQPSDSGLVDVSTLYAKINKPEGGRESSSTKSRNCNKVSSSSSGHKDDFAAVEPRNCAEMGQEGPGNNDAQVLKTAESFASIEMLVSDMCNSLSNETSVFTSEGTGPGSVEKNPGVEEGQGGGKTPGSGEGERSEDGEAQEVAEDGFYVNLD